MPRGLCWNNRFNNFGSRLTITRETIINILQGSEKHLSAEDIYFTAHTKNPSIGLTTVYRTLDLLTQMGIVYKFDFGDKRARYELVEEYSNKKHHHHLICVSCKSIIDYTDFIKDEIDFIKNTENGLEKKFNFKIKNHTIHFHGICENCQNT